MKLIHPMRLIVKDDVDRMAYQHYSQDIQLIKEAEKTY